MEYFQSIKEHIHRHTVLIIVRRGSQSFKVLIEAEDSFYQLCPLISEVDLYFCHSYNLISLSNPTVKN